MKKISYSLDREKADCDQVDGFIDDMKRDLVKVYQFINDALPEECSKQTEKELLQVIVKVIKYSISVQVNIEYVILRLIDILPMSLD